MGRRFFDPGDDEWDDSEDELPTALELTVYPDEEEPDVALWLPDGTPLYRYKAPFGFCRPVTPPCENE